MYTAVTLLIAAITSADGNINDALSLPGDLPRLRERFSRSYRSLPSAATAVLESHHAKDGHSWAPIGEGRLK